MITESELVNAIRTLVQREQAPSVSLLQLSKDYLEIYARQHKRSSSKDQRYLEKYILPYFGNVTITEVSTIQIQRLHSHISQRYPIAANRAVEVLSKMFALAEEWGYFNGPNPCKKVKHNKENSRERYLNEDEVVRLLDSIDKETPWARALLYLYLLTGRRKEELRRLSWDQIDFEKQTLNFFDSKKAQWTIIPLPRFAISILLDLPKSERRVFVGSSKQYICLDKLWRKIRVSANLKDATIHDLRRTCATWLLCQGENLETISQVLNHSSRQATLIYARVTKEKVRGALDKLGDRIENLRSSPAPQRS